MRLAGIDSRQFGIDMDDVDSRGDGFAKVVIVGSRSAVQGQEEARRLLDLGNSFDIQVFLRVSLRRALEHAVHVPDRRSENIDSG